MMLMMMLMIKLICACVLRREAGSSKVLFENMKVELKPELEFVTYMFTVEKKNAYVLFVAETENVNTFPGFLTFRGLHLVDQLIVFGQAFLFCPIYPFLTYLVKS